MSVLIVMAPPMAAMFFSGTLGQFAANKSFGNVGRNSSGSMSDFKTNYDARSPSVDETESDKQGLRKNVKSARFEGMSREKEMS